MVMLRTRQPHPLHRVSGILADKTVTAIAWAILAVALALLSSPASAGTLTTWTGSGGNLDWTTAGNWNPSANAPTTSGTYDLVFSGTNQSSGFVVATVNNVGLVNISSMSFTNTGTLAPGQSSFINITGGTFALDGSTITTTAAGGTNNPFGSNSNGDMIFSALTLAGTSTVTTNNLHNLSLMGPISGSGAVIFDDGSVSTTEYVYLAGTNSYAGGTWIRGGFVQTGARVDAVSLLASTSNNFAFGSGAVTVSDNGTLLVRNSSTVTNTLTISGSGAGSGSLTGSFGIAGQTAVYAGPITVAGNTRFSTSSGAAGDTTSKFVISGNVDLTTSLLTLRSQRQGTQAIGLPIEITGTMFGVGGVNIEGSGTWSRVVISGSNSYSGGTTVTTGSLTVGSSTALGTGFLAVNTAGLNLNGQSLQVGALSGSTAGLIESRSGASSLQSTSAANTTYAGTIRDGSGSVSFGLAGSGTLTLTGSNSYTGSTAIDGGVLVMGSLNALAGGGDIDFGGGTLRYTSVNTLDYSNRFTNSAGAISIDTNGELVTFASAIEASNVGGLTKLGLGTLYLNAANQFTGPTTVTSGTLAGTGSVLGLFSVLPGAVFDPGASPSATTIFGVGGFSQATGGTTKLQVSGTTPGTLHDQVTFTGITPAITWGGQLEITLAGSYANFTAFDLFSGFTTQSGNLTGITFSAPGSPYDGLAFTGPTDGVWTTGTTGEGQYVTFDQTTGVLLVVPEPGTLAIAAAGLAAAGLGLRQRRRPVAR